MKLPLLLGLLLLVVGCSHDGHSHNNENHHNENNHHDGGHDEGGHHDGGHDVTLTPDVVDATAEANAYCQCMLLTCHDLWHEKHGEDDAEAMADCVAEVSALPHIGTPQMSGNSVECRQYLCDESAADESICPDALGPGCTD